MSCIVIKEFLKCSKSSELFFYFYVDFYFNNLKNIIVFCGSSVGHSNKYKNLAIELGNYLVDHGYRMVFGGGKVGLMGITADTMLAKGGHVIGVIPKLLEQREVVHRGVSELYISKTMAERKIKMSDTGDAYIAMPGGYGTLDEQTGPILFLASDDASYITGVTVPVGGGDLG